MIARRPLGASPGVRWCLWPRSKTPAKWAWRLARPSARCGLHPTIPSISGSLTIHRCMKPRRMRDSGGWWARRSRHGAHPAHHSTHHPLAFTRALDRRQPFMDRGGPVPHRRCLLLCRPHLNARREFGETVQTVSLTTKSHSGVVAIRSGGRISAKTGTREAARRIPLSRC